MRRILIVDDEPVIADTLGLIFGKSGFEVSCVYSADTALVRGREFTPDLLLCDINMPGRDGLALIGDFARELPSCRILVLTGSYDSLCQVHDRVEDPGNALAVMTKPCQPADLLRQAGLMLQTA